MTVTLDDMPTLRLIKAEEGLHSAYELRRAAGADTSPIVEAHTKLTRVLAKRQILWEPLDKAFKADSHSGPAPTFTHPEDDPEIEEGKTKTGKGGEKNRTQDDEGTPLHEGGDPNNDGTLGYIKVGPHVLALSKSRDFCTSCHRPVEHHLAKATGKLTDGDGSGGGQPTPLTAPMVPLSDDQRREYARTGIARADGSLPIPDEAHLHAAVRLVGQTQDPQAAMQHIITRAQAMGLTGALPDAWTNADQGTDENGKEQKGSNAKSDDQRPGQGATNTSKSLDLSSGIEEINLDGDYAYAMVKAVEEERYTLGPLYLANTLDAHDEWATPKGLRKAMRDYVQRSGGDRSVYLQHSPLKAGEWISIMQWPNEVKANMIKSVDGMQKSESVVFPADTVYLGVVWEPWAWEAVKKGRISGFSMGGWARRIEGAPAA